MSYLKFTRSTFKHIVIRYSLTWIIVCYSLSFIGLIFSAYFIFNAPYDYQQKLSVKIMYVHVPCAWIALLCYSFMTLIAIYHLYHKQIFTQLALQHSAVLGSIFTFLALFSGALWGQLSWGSWWEWDARLTSFLILFFLYLLIIALNHAFFDPERAAIAQALITIFGSINLPIIKFSVTWWHSLHQGSSFLSLKKSTIDPTILHPLLLSTFSLTFLFFAFLSHRLYLAMRQEKLDQFIKNFYQYKKNL